jgi:hypothetical protein
MSKILGFMVEFQLLIILSTWAFFSSVATRKGKREEDNHAFHGTKFTSST